MNSYKFITGKAIQKNACLVVYCIFLLDLIGETLILNLTTTMMAKYFFVFFVVLCIGIGSCKKEKDAVNCTSWSTEIQAEATAFSNAMTVWATNQTPTNCTAMKNAGTAYVNALKSFTSCADAWAAATKTQWQTLVTTTESQIASMCK